MNTKLTNILLIILLVFNIAFVGSWWFGHIRMHRQMKRREMRAQTPDILHDKSKGEWFLVKTLGFDSAQKMKLHELVAAHQKFDDDFLNSNTRIQTEIFNALKDNKDTAYINLCADSMAMLKAAMEKELFRHFTRVKEICNTEQLAKFNELMDNMSNEFRHRHDFQGNMKPKQDSL